MLARAGALGAIPRPRRAELAATARYTLVTGTRPCVTQCRLGFVHDFRLLGRGVVSDKPTPTPRIVVVEDEPDIAALVAYELTRAGFRVETANDGAAALEAIRRAIPDLMVLDRMLPGMSGDDVLRTVRADPGTRAIPVLMLTAKRDQEDRIAGLELGVDDYLTKPFSPRELVLRVEAILRRIRQPAVESGTRVLKAGSLTLNLASFEASVEGVPVALTPTEFRLLQTLLERQGRTQSRRNLLEKAWDLDARVATKIQTRTVDMHVRRLRQKLGPVGHHIETVRGFGYRFSPPSEF